MSDLTEKKTFDPQAAVEAIREKIRGHIADMIPAEQWDAMIRAEMNAFMNDVPRKDQWGNTMTTQPAGFKAVVRGLLEEDAKRRVKEFLSSAEWTAHYKTNGMDREAGSAIQEFIQENAGQILNAWIGTAMQSIVDQLRYKA